MSDSQGDQLLAAASKLDKSRERFDALVTSDGPLARLGDEAELVQRSWSGSSLGYHSRVYYEGLVVPPSGARFDAEWGLNDTFSNTMRGDWMEYSGPEVVSAIEMRAGNPNLSEIEDALSQLAKDVQSAKSDALSILSVEMSNGADTYLTSIQEKIGRIRARSAIEFQRMMVSDRQILTRDSAAVSEGIKIAPHQVVMARVASLAQPLKQAEELSVLMKQAGSHLVRLRKTNQKASLVGTNVFIGHGRSSVWRDLKDFLGERLRLPYDEFNRVPVAGFTNIARLSEMLDSAAIAFIVLTAEDEQADGAMHARQNVIHEAGLFQGRLGFSRAIIVLEEGCEEFSNVQGLGQIRFPKGNIQAKFEEIRQVLEREGLLG
ncbi:TIR domain-containing protein [Brevundimonas fontaquae]|uniref:Nucleotide-binding protein n=1 Tax=Brevundimonas fontaquae TaxID=2813778 RepID=A0ABX7LM13_9CAUL|nr:TIR domain-containing protein [Brevundimonas fontaquae]QSF53858.1 nucleotide-binding protein [Brevundimonas fontaquae]